MSQNDPDEKERIARELTGQSFAELSTVQQNVIASCVGKAAVKDPFDMMRGDSDE